MSNWVGLNTYNESSILTSGEMNTIENKIYALNNYIKNVVIEEENGGIRFSKKSWSVDEFIQLYNVQKIELWFKEISHYYTKPLGWTEIRKWNEEIPPIISYRDLNRWVNNINLVYDLYIKDINSKDTIYWNGIYLASKEVEWGQSLGIEWEE